MGMGFPWPGCKTSAIMREGGRNPGVPTLSLTQTLAGGNSSGFRSEVSMLKKVVGSALKMKFLGPGEGAWKTTRTRDAP